jgi:hypothetical protein
VSATRGSCRRSRGPPCRATPTPGCHSTDGGVAATAAP